MTEEEESKRRTTQKDKVNIEWVVAVHAFLLMVFAYDAVVAVNKKR